MVWKNVRICKKSLSWWNGYHVWYTGKQAGICLNFTWYTRKQGCYSFRFVNLTMFLMYTEAGIYLVLHWSIPCYDTQGERQAYTYSFTFVNLSTKYLETFHDNKCCYDGICSSNCWNDVPCHCWKHFKQNIDSKLILHDSDFFK